MKRQPCQPKRRKRGCETSPKKKPVKPKAAVDVAGSWRVNVAYPNPPEGLNRSERGLDGTLYRWCVDHGVYHPWGGECVAMSLRDLPDEPEGDE